MAGGRLAHTPQCDQHEETIYFGRNSANSKLPLQPAAILASEKWLPLIYTYMKSSTF